MLGTEEMASGSAPVSTAGRVEVVSDGEEAEPDARRAGAAVSLIDQMLASPPGDMGGAIAANRLAYQRLWAICRILELHGGGQDYRIVFEWHDDVLELDSASAPSAVTLYQVKTRKGAKAYTAGELTRRHGKKNPRSWLGKLVAHGFGAFKASVASMVFVSAPGCKLKMGDGTACLDAPRACLIHADEDTLEEIKTKLATELGVKEAQLPLDRVFLWNAGLDLDDTESHTLGRLARFLEEHFPKVVDANALLKTLLREANRRSCKEAHPASEAELYAERSIARADLAKMLTDAGAYVGLDALRDSIERRLNADGVPPGVVVRTLLECETYWLDRRADSSALLADSRQQVMERVRELLSAAPESASTLSDVVGRCLAPKTQELGALEGAKSTTYMKAMVMVEFYEQSHVPPADSQPEDPRA